MQGIQKKILYRRWGGECLKLKHLKNLRRMIEKLRRGVGNRQNNMPEINPNGPASRLNVTGLS